MKRGKVYLVGAGPGDPGLITVKGLECLKLAGVVIYDHLLNEKLLDAIRPGVKKIYAGKTARHHTSEQDEINQLLLEQAGKGKLVVRLKGGDPFVFGRGGEEAEALARNGIPFEIVPGVSAAVAVPAYAGIPVTHRGLSSSFAVITGHEAVNKDISTIAWDKIATATGTLVFLMAVQNLGQIVQRLTENGKPASTPVAVIANGTSPEQQTLVGTLENIVSQAEQADLQPPAVMVVGDVVRMREHIRWFDILPLFGKRVLVTRPGHQSGKFSQMLTMRGAIPVEVPAIRIEPALSEELNKAISNLGTYRWLIFTSVNGVEAFFQRLYALNLDSRHLHNVRIGAIGPATAGALEARGLRTDFVPKKYTSGGLLTGLTQEDLAGCRVLLPRADIAGKELAEGISRLGGEVHEVITYKTVPNKIGIPQVKRMLSKGEIDIVTFTSSSTATSLVNALGKQWSLINKVLVACIGPVTKATATRAGLRVDLVARKHTVDGLVEAIERYFKREGKDG